MSWSAAEQQSFVSTLRDAGPDAPTLCSPWRTRHLAAHVYLRLHRPAKLAAAMLSEGMDAVVMRVGDDAAGDRAYQTLLDRFVAAAPWWNPVAMGGDLANLVEYVVHHEDVRRAADPAPAPRTLPAGLNAALWSNVKHLATLTLPRDSGVVLVVPNGPRAVVRRGAHSTAIIGSPVELAMHISGRTEHANVRLVRA